MCLIGGCKSQGPGKLAYDHFDYGTAIGTASKTETLMNIVKMRYLDQPVFLEIKSVVAGYNWEYTGNAGISLRRIFAANERDSATLGYTGKYVERPTISYTPLAGADFVKGILNPIKSSVVLLMVEAGLPADEIFETMVQSVNGKDNFHIIAGNGYPPNPAFTRFSTFLQKMQLENAISIQIEEAEGQKLSTKVRFHPDILSLESQQELEEVKDLMGMSKDTNTYSVVWASYAKDPNQLAIETRSVFSMIKTLSWFVDVPPEDIDRSIALPINLVTADDAIEQIPMMHIYSSTKAPEDPFASVRYNNRWYWIDNTDTDLKRSFNYLNLMLNIMKSGEVDSPQLVISTN